MNFCNLKNDKNRPFHREAAPCQGKNQNRLLTAIPLFGGSVFHIDINFHEQSTKRVRRPQGLKAIVINNYYFLIPSFSQSMSYIKIIWHSKFVIQNYLLLLHQLCADSVRLQLLCGKILAFAIILYRY